MSFDDDLDRFQEIVKDFDLSRSGKRNARRAARLAQKGAAKSSNPWLALVEWSERRARTKHRPWA